MNYVIASHEYDTDRWAWCLFKADDSRLGGPTVRNARQATAVTPTRVHDQFGNEWIRFGDNSLKLVA